MQSEGASAESAAGFAILLLALVTALATFAGATPGSIDDALITLVYARHLLEHGSLHWNLADGAVEGFTSTLDMLLKAGVLAALRPDDGLRTAWWLSFGFHLATAASAVAVAWRLGRERGARAAAALALVGGLAVASNPALADGAVFLLETSLYVLLAFWCCALPLLAKGPLPRRAGPWVALCIALVLVRPEGIAIVAALVGAALVFSPAGEARARSLRTAAACGAAVLGFYAWRWWTFGVLAPNTYYAKTSASRWLEVQDGFRYLGHFATDEGVLGILLLALTAALPFAVLSARWSSAGSRRGFAIQALIGAGLLAVAVVSGGDSYRGGRFLAAPLVLGLLGITVLAARGPGRLRTAALASLALVSALGLAKVASNAPKLPQQVARWPAGDGDLRCPRIFSERLAALAGPQRVIAQSDFQMLKYFADDVNMLDLSGLNHAGIAHRPFEGIVWYGKFRHEWALEFAPDVWLYGYRFATQRPMARVPLAELLDRPELYDRFVGYGSPPELRPAIVERYVPASLRVCGSWYNFLLKRELAAEFARGGALVGDGLGSVIRSPSPD